ncbi:MAG: hypothetical protein HYV07_23330 [Deltaproteobacteria bacterium]|nr:hypothetical protein [Deltaproteobacteria bacterium]
MAAWSALLSALSSCAPLLVWQGTDPSTDRKLALFEHGGRQYLVVDGIEGRTYRSIALQGVAVGRDRTVAYPALRTDGWVVVIDGREGPSYAGIGSVVMSPAGRVAYSAESSLGWRVVLDGRESAPFDRLVPETLDFGLDERLSYVMGRGGRVYVVIEGRTSAAADEVTELVRSWDTGAIAYFVHKGKRCSIVRELAEVSALDFEQCRGLIARGGRLGFTAWRDGCVRAYVDGVEVPGSCGVDPSSLRFSATGSTLSWASERADGVWLNVGERTFGPFESAEPAEFTPGCDERESTCGSPPVTGAEAWAAVVRTGGRAQILVDGSTRATHRAASGLVMGPDGQTLAYQAADDSGPFVSFRGRAFPHDVLLTGTLVVSLDGRHVGYVAGRRESRTLHVFVDGAPSLAVGFDELAAELVRRPDPRTIPTKLRALVRAELARVAQASDVRNSRRSAKQSRSMALRPEAAAAGTPPPGSTQ